MRATNELGHFAVFLRNAAPREFDEFYKAFEAYTLKAMQQLLEEIPSTDLQRYQGHAQQCKKLMDMFNEARRS